MTSVPLAAVFSDRRAWLFISLALLALLLAFVAIPDSMALTLVSRAGFWLVFITFTIWVWALGKTLRSEWREVRWRTLDWITIAMIAVSGVVLLSHEPFGFKIVMDELMLLGTSMSMHLDKVVLTPLRGNDIQGAFVIVEGIIDKRPLFFPFLVSLVHDLAGYRPANAFVVNVALTFVFLGLVYLAGRMIAGRVAGWIGVVLFAGLPLLAQNSTGGGFELLNLVMMLGTMLLGARYVLKRDDASLVALCYAGMLLAQVRYESVIFLLPVALVVAWVCYREQRIQLPWPILLAPLLMVHYPLQHRIFDIRASSWEMFSKPGYSEPFSVSYIPENLEHAVKFFFGRASDQPNSIVLSALGCVAIPFFMLLVIKRLRTLSTESAGNVAVTIFALGFLLQFGLMMCYFWGKFDDAVIRRLSLPTQLGMVLALLAILPQFAKPAILRAVFTLALVGLLARSVPSMAAHAYSQEYLPGRETAWRRDFMARYPRHDYLMIDNDATLWVTHLVSATPTVVATKRTNDIAFHMRNRTFSDVFVFQRLNIDAETGRQTLREGDDLGPAFVLEPVIEQRLQLLTISRISRVKEIKSGGETLSAPPTTPPPPFKDRAAIEKARREFLETYMKKLP
jgi:hypothetical protein